MYNQNGVQNAKYKKLSAFLAVLAVFWSASLSEIKAAQTYVAGDETSAIKRYLKRGDSGSDVLVLQEFLNSRAETKVAETGPGSPGNETAYFGALTAAAVARFQKLHEEEILAPLGLFEGTGYVGALTVKKINSLSAPVAKIGGETAKKAAGGETAKRAAPKIFSVSPEHAAAGTLLTLNGSGFDALDNTVYASFNKLTGIPSADGKTIQFVVKEPFPTDLEVPDFIRKEYKTIQYGFYVKNRYGRSNDILFALDLVKP